MVEFQTVLYPTDGQEILGSDNYTKRTYDLENDVWIESIDTALLSNIKRTERNNLLRDTDWTQLSDVSLSVQEKTNWVNYRQLLREVPQQENFPTDITWPSPP